MFARFFLLLFLAVLSGFSPLYAQGFDDEFDKSTLAPGWTWVRENPDFWIMTGTQLQIKTQLGALNGQDYNDVHNILLQDAPAGTFRCETKLYFFVQEALHNAGLIYYVDDDNYIRVSRGKFNNVNGLWMETEVNGVTGFSYVNPMTSADVYLRLSRTGSTTFLATYSLNGTEWYEIGREITGFASSATPRIGLQAANGSGLSATRLEIPAKFDYFRVSLTSVESPGSPASPEALTLSPHPIEAGARTVVTLHMPSNVEEVRDVTLYSVLGTRRGAWHPSRTDARDVSISVSDLAPGMYHVVVGLASGRILTTPLLVR